MFAECYRNRRVLVTGHTGFKGSWLALWLQALEAHVTGIALAPDTVPNHWDLLKLGIPEHRIDIRDAGRLSRAVSEAKPEIVFHLAAQSLVRRSYREPLATWSTNVMGCVNLLEVCRSVDDLRAIIVVTSDKCYENKWLSHGYRETDRLGGHDPYSASKAAAELAAASYRSAFSSHPSSPLIATARAGNVIGGGDWAEDRLIPDLVRALDKGESLAVRSPDAIRPWQYVLEPLSGYLQLGQRLLQGQQPYADAWNFGPERDSALTVADLLERLRLHWPEMAWHHADIKRPHETELLLLDSSKAREHLGWHPALTMEQQLAMTAEWYRAFHVHGEAVSRQQLETYVAAAKAAGCTWC